MSDERAVGFDPSLFDVGDERHLLVFRIWAESICFNLEMALKTSATGNPLMAKGFYLRAVELLTYAPDPYIRVA